MLDSSGVKIQLVKVHQDGFSFKAAQLQLSARGTIELKIRGFVAYFHRIGEPRRGEKQRNG
jgi:hypothetical protein